MSQPQNLLEAYYSIYEEPINEENLTEEEHYYNVAEFLLDEGFTEEEIIALSEEEDFLEILDYIEEKMTAADYRSLSRHGKKRLRQSGMKLQDPHEYKGAAAKKSREGVQSRRAERQAWDDATPRQKEIAKRGRESEQRVKLAKLETEVEKTHQDNKKVANKPGMGDVVKALASGALARFTAGEKVRGQRVSKGRNISPEVQKRYERRAGYKAIKKSLGEDYFDIVADYLLENFEFQSEEHFYSTMASLGEEVIGNIVDEILNEETPQQRQARWAKYKEGAPETPQERAARWAKYKEGYQEPPQERARRAAIKANTELNRQYRERERQSTPAATPARALPKVSAPVSRPTTSVAPKPTPKPAVPQGQGTVGGLRTVGGQGTATSTGSLPSQAAKVSPTASTAPVVSATPQPKAPIISSIFKDKSNPLSR